LQWIHAVLRHVANAGCRVIPVPLATESGPSFVDWHQRLWELSPWQPGIADFERDPRPAKLQAAMHMLADFHCAASSYPGCKTTVGPAAGLPARIAFMRQLDDGLLARLWNCVHHQGSAFFPEAQAILTAYERHRERVALMLSDAIDRAVRNHVCLRDVWHDHVLFLDERVTGLVDFGAMQVDCAAADLSRLLGSLVPDDEQKWLQALAAYESKRPLTENERLAVRAYDVSSVLLSGMNWLRWLLIDGREFDALARVRSRLRSIIRRLQRL
jgi:Ser/Thr protein kinase RdoA (MazF antagonist)